jgi:hypothetical protein
LFRPCVSPVAFNNADLFRAFAEGRCEAEMRALTVTKVGPCRYFDIARIKTRSLALGLLAAVACAGRAENLLVTDTPTLGPVVQRIEGAPADATPVDRIEVDASATPSALSSMNGLIAVGTPAGVFIGSRTQIDTLSALPVLAATGEPQSTGAVHLMARRASGGLLIHAENGLFHDSNGALLPSPLSAALAGKPLTSLDAFGSGDSEELWMIAGGVATHVSGGQLKTFEIGDGSAVPDAVIAVDTESAIVAQAGSAYLIDLDPLAATLIADRLGHVNGFDRSEDGSVYLATESGLLERTRAGDVSLRTLAPAGSPPVSVLGVSAAFGSVVAETSQWLARIDTSGAATLRSAASPRPGSGVAVDANGDTWSADEGKLFRVLTGRPVSFASDVKPFFDGHCMSCHRTGALGAPIRNFDDFETAKSYSALIARRLQAIGIPPMPPAYVETLTASDYAVVIRWIGGGLQP